MIAVKSKSRGVMEERKSTIHLIICSLQLRWMPYTALCCLQSDLLIYHLVKPAVNNKTNSTLTDTSHQRLKVGIMLPPSPPAKRQWTSICVRSTPCWQHAQWAPCTCPDTVMRAPRLSGIGAGVSLHAGSSVHRILLNTSQKTESKA